MSFSRAKCNARACRKHRVRVSLLKNLTLISIELIVQT